MAPDSFHLFALLPFELRCMIYLFASPPRIVHVQEHCEDYDDFVERFRNNVFPIKLHPSIAYFAHNWRNRIPWPPRPWRPWYRHHQYTLDMYGFTCPRPKHLPWEPTEEVPAIPHHFLAENPEVAWEFLRTGVFYSTAPIPTLLHVTRESRQFLIDKGYELAFRTRTCGPRVWFNFKTDILYLGRYYHDWSYNSCHFLLSGNELWDIGQFEPSDLKRVRRLALRSSGELANYRVAEGVDIVSSMLQLFNGVEELFFEEPGLNTMTYMFSQNKHINKKGVWYYTPVAEVDILSSTLGPRETMVFSTGPDHLDLKAYKQDNMGDGTRYFVDIAHEFEKKLTLRRDELVGHKSSAQWRIPEVKIVYIGNSSLCERLFQWRWAVWNRFEALKEEKYRSEAAEEAKRSIDVPKRPIYDHSDVQRNKDLPPSPFTEQFQDDLEALQEIIDMDWHGHHGEYFGREDEHHDYGMEDYYARHNWIYDGMVAAPAI